MMQVNKSKQIEMGTETVSESQREELKLKGGKEANRQTDRLED